MPIDTGREGETLALTLTGAIDIFDARALHAAAREAVDGHDGPVLVRLEAVTALDTASTQVLLALARALADRRRAFHLSGAPAAVTSMWTLAGIPDDLAS